MPDFRRVSTTERINAIASPLIAMRDEREELVHGTAFVIGRGFALTAYHVLADYVERYEGIKNSENSLSLTFEMFMYLTLSDGDSYLPVKVLKAWSAMPLDLAILALGIPKDWPSDYVWPVPILRLLPPKVGESITAFGFAESSVEHSLTDPIPQIEVNARASTGIVQEVHHEFRDTSRLAFPCFRTNARLDGGMSGGPVFDSGGKLCGVACSSIPPMQEEKEHISYCTSLWPIIAIMVDAGETIESTGAYYPFLELIQQGIILVENDAVVSLTLDRDGRLHPVVLYDRRSWSVDIA
jgi:S1-C subfamily serine protease